ncbi:germ cell nuclear acidic protein-like isoform X2 [Oscarella lobularis]|uniref:germ cell nuclear acidic protein-like isoform X2 n=1 Tax=Oscarella lobularis TaxID=121494 RepID=UPI0033140702
MEVLIVLPESSLKELRRMKDRFHITSIKIVKELPEPKTSPSPSPIRRKKTRACRIVDSEEEEDEEEAISRKSFDEDDDVISEPKSSADEEDSIVVVESDSDEEKEENSEASPRLVNTSHCSFIISEAEEGILSKSFKSENDDVSDDEDDDDEESFHLVGKFTLDDDNDSKPKRFIRKNSIVFDLEEDFTLDITPSPVQRRETTTKITDKSDDDDDDDLTFHLGKLRLDDEDDDSSWKNSKKLTEESEVSPSPIQAKKTQKRRILYSDEDEDEEKAKSLGKDSDDDDLPLFSLDDDSEEKKKKSSERTVIACSDTDSDAENEPMMETTTKKKKKRRVSFWNLGNSVPQPVTPFKTATPCMATPCYATLYKGLRTPKSAASFLKTPQTAIGQSGQYNRYKSSLISDLFIIYNESVFNGKLPDDLKFEWNARLTSTAGSCAYTWKNNERSATITLSTKIIDSYERLRDTLIHELCHAATWIIDNDRHAHHGPAWKKWVRIAESIHPDLPCVSRCHNYSINTKYTYICQNSDCYFSEGRHSKSINLDRARCPVCMSRLQLMNKSGHSSAARSNPYCDFVKQNFARVQRENPHLKFHEISKILASQYRTPAKF